MILSQFRSKLREMFLVLQNYVMLKGLLNELKWESFTDRRRKHRLITFNKMNNNISPDYLSELIPTQVDQPNNLRNTLNVPSLSARTQLYSSSFLPQTVRDWSSLSIDLLNSTSLSAFKPSLNQQANKSTHIV